MTEEKKLQKKIIDYLTLLGAYVVKSVNMNKNGVPDILCCFEGLFIAIEVKGDKNKPTELQNFNINKIKKAKGIAFCTNNFNEAKENIDNFVKKCRNAEK